MVVSAIMMSELLASCNNKCNQRRDAVDAVCPSLTGTAALTVVCHLVQALYVEVNSSTLNRRREDIASTIAYLIHYSHLIVSTNSFYCCTARRRSSNPAPS